MKMLNSSRFYHKTSIFGPHSKWQLWKSFAQYQRCENL